jgi:hypothetical protein
MNLRKKKNRGSFTGSGLRMVRPKTPVNINRGMMHISVAL